MKNYFSILIILCLLLSCSKSDNKVQGVSSSITPSYKAENVIVIVMDGPRYSETWGLAGQGLIPNLANKIAPKSVVSTNFRNNGPTYTSPGHLAICTGQYYNLNNSGGELPPFPSMFQYYNEKYPLKNSWLIASKDKLEVLTNTSDSSYHDLHMANTDCGNNGLGTGYRNDSITLDVALNVFATQHPNLTLINFREPDFTGHSYDSLGYINQITVVDSLINILFEFVENDPIYNDNTAIFITNDHGRHDDASGSFASHGDNCEGCRKIMFFASGPDFKKNVIINTPYEQIDIAATISEILDFPLPNSNGQVMTELFD